MALRLSDADLGRAGTGSQFSSDSAKAIVVGLNFVVKAGEIVMVTGESGCGKSTLLRALAGLDPLISGDLQLKSGHEGYKSFSKGVNATDWRCRVGYAVQKVPTEPGFCQTPVETARRMDSFSALKRWKTEKHYPSTADLAQQLVTDWGIDKDEIDYTVKNEADLHRDLEAASPEEKDGVLERTSLFMKPWSMASGGQQQRLMLAITMARLPDYLLLDEPTSALDATSAEKVENSLLNFASGTWPAEVRSQSTAGSQRSAASAAGGGGPRGLVWVTHSPQQAERLRSSPAHHIKVVAKGEWLRDGAKICAKLERAPSPV